MKDVPRPLGALLWAGLFAVAIWSAIQAAWDRAYRMNDINEIKAGQEWAAVRPGNR